MKKLIALLTFIPALALAAATSQGSISYQTPAGARTNAEVFDPTSTASHVGALRVAHKGTRLYSSGSVAAGAVISSGVLNVAGLTELEVYADNSGGDAFRDVQVTMFDDDGVTPLGTTVTVKTVPYASGYSVQSASITIPHPVGYSRIYIGPNPPSGNTGIYTLAISTSADNGTMTTIVPGEECSALWAVSYDTSGSGTYSLTPFEVTDAGTSKQIGGNGTTNWHTLCWGLGCGAITPTLATNLYLPIPPARRSRFQTTAGGSGTITQTTIKCLGRPPGFSAVQLTLPAKIKIDLTAAGTGAASLVVMGR